MHQRESVPSLLLRREPKQNTNGNNNNNDESNEPLTKPVVQQHVGVSKPPHDVNIHSNRMSVSGVGEMRNSFCQMVDAMNEYR